MNLAKTSSISIPAGKGQQFTLVGRSRAGDGTSFAIPELKWMFDCGALVQGWKPKVVFITHGHSDHVHFLPHMKNASRPPRIHLPQELEPFVQSFFRVHQAMSDCMTEEESMNGGKYEEDYQLKPTKAGEEIQFSQGGIQFIVRILKMDHRVPCIGYSIFKLQKSLKKEFVGLPGREIGKLRKEGVEINEIKQEPFLCFMGDTTAAVFDTHPEILQQHKLIVIECSFFDKKSVERGKTTKHMHWFDLKPIVQANPNTLFVLIHFSLKYSSLKIREFFCEEQKSFPNVHPLLLEEEVEEEWQKANPCNGDCPKCRCRMCF